MEGALGTDVLAKLFDVDPSNLTHLWKKGVITRMEPGKYPPIAITQYIRYLRGRSHGRHTPLSGGTGGDPTVVDEKLRLTKAQADTAELKLKIMRGDLHSAEDVKLIVGNMIAQFKQRALTVPHKAAPLLAVTRQDPAVYEAILMEEMKALLNILKEYNPEDYGISASEQENDRPIQDDSSDSDATT